MSQHSLNGLIDDFDQKHLWHPYTAAFPAPPAFKVVGAYDRTLILADGTRLIDAMSSWWCCNLGYNVPAITAVLKGQASVLSHVMFAGLTHEPAINLGQKLLHLLPYMEHIFYADSGSVATEVALKMALQYQIARGQPERCNFLTVRSGYHGDTWNAMSVSGSLSMHALFSTTLPQRFVANNPTTPYPGSIVASKKPEHAALRGDAMPSESYVLEVQPDFEQELSEIATMLQSSSYNIAAMIIEPIVQGAGGMYFYHPGYLKRLKELCQEHGVLLIADEIATGFGRTGKLWAQDYVSEYVTTYTMPKAARPASAAPANSETVPASIAATIAARTQEKFRISAAATRSAPDIMLLGKGLTAGYMTLSAVLCQKHVGEMISSHSPHFFMHGPTFMANPLACAVAGAAIDCLLSLNFSDRVQQIEDQLKQDLAPLINYECVREIRVFGAIGVVELTKPMTAPEVSLRCLDLGVWLRPMGNLLYTMPPLTTSQDELAQITKAMHTLVQEHEVKLSQAATAGQTATSQVSDGQAAAGQAGPRAGLAAASPELEQNPESQTKLNALDNLTPIA